MSTYPRLAPVRQHLYSSPCEDVPDAVRKAVRAAIPEGKIEPGQKIALTAGSRGIDNIGLILKTAVDAVRKLRCEPFIVPTMGSHGGATGEGQAQLLDRVFGINEETMGCPIRSTMEVVELGRTPEHDLPVYIDRHQAEADGILVIAREKAHTDFHGPYESGLFKMICIGMGKKAQAESVHAFGAWGLRELMPEVARAKIRMAPILGGLAILEDGCDRTSEIIGLPADRIEAEEPKLLERAKRNQARLPFDELDLLVVDRMSKEISGTGMDTTVIGRRRMQGEPEWEKPRIDVIFVRDLDTHASDNVVGIGLADLTTRRLHEKADIKKTQVNGLTSTFAMRLMIPVVSEHDREALDHAMYLLRRKKPEEIRMARIRDTTHLEKLFVSEALLGEVRDNPALEQLGEPGPILFDPQENLYPDEVMEAPTSRAISGIGEARKAA